MENTAFTGNDESILINFVVMENPRLTVDHESVFIIGFVRDGEHRVHWG